MIFRAFLLRDDYNFQNVFNNTSLQLLNILIEASKGGKLWPQDAIGSLKTEHIVVRKRLPMAQALVSMGFSPLFSGVCC